MKEKICKQNPTGISPKTILPFKVRNRGRVRGTCYHSTPGTHHGDVTLILVIDGAGYYRRNNRSQTIRTGMVGLIHPRPAPGVLLADRHDPYDYFYCRFSGHEALQTAERLAAPDHNRPFTHCADWQRLADAFSRMLRSRGLPKNTQPERMTPVDAALAEVLTLLECPRSMDAPSRINRSRLVRYMEDHISQPADLDRMADFFAISKEHLCRVGKQMLGETIHRRWVTMRMAWAKTLLEDDLFSVADVGCRVGYTDSHYFAKVFKRETGLSPRAWRAG